MSERRIKPTKDDYPPPWEDRPVSIERWRKHRGVMLQWAYPGSRPREWWLYEKQMPRPDQEAAALLEMGELSAAELAELMPVWRERYERSWEPGFVYNAGARGWLEGAPARKAWYRLFGIPPAIVRQWNAERRRSAKVVRELKRAAKETVP